MKITINSIKKATLFLALMLSSMHIVAQDINEGLSPSKLLPQFTNLSPEAASLGKYGAIQASEYSGAANISIPLYTVNSGVVSFPINLYYDASGIKVEQDATFVGLGWNLNYGGMISHIVCGYDDFREESIYTSFWKPFWEQTKGLPKDQPCQTFSQVKSTMGFMKADPSIGDAWFPMNEGEFYTYYNMSRGYDTPDVFQASFCGQSISFIIDKRAGKGSDKQDSVIILNDNARKYKISYKIGSYRYPSSFTIIDDKGMSYVFNAYSENVNQYQQADSYYLTKVYGSDGINGKSVVTLEYNQPAAYYCGKGSRPKSKVHISNARRIKNSGDDIPDMDQVFRDQYNSMIRQNYSEQEIGCAENGHCKKVYPKRIITALDTIEFSTSGRLDIPGALKISGITVKSKVKTTPKTISFLYDYFLEDSPKSDYSGKRLKLTGVNINGQKYKFSYDDKKLPAWTSYSKDFWGYYNGANPTATRFVACTPAYTISNNGVVSPTEHFDGSNRFASEKLCNVGMLKRVTYPTGGYTDYEYEANRFNDKYYYPDASNSNITFPASSYTVNDGSIAMYGNMSQTKTLNFAQNTKIDVRVTAVLMGTDELSIIIRNMSTNAIVKSVYYRANKQIGETFSLSLTKGINYKIEAKLTAAASNSSSTVAQCQFTHEVVNANVTASPLTKNENGGYSIGGGLRIKSIKNYDSDNTYINGVAYEYSGGKLLSPTVQLETHYVDFSYDYTTYTTYGEFDEEKGVLKKIPLNTQRVYPKFSFYYANTEPSYPYICSLDIPATVGYDCVVKKEIDKSGKILRKTVLKYHNQGWVSDEGNTNTINSRMQNSFFFNSYYSNNPAYAQGHLNGKIKEETKYSDTEKIAYQSKYTYYCKQLGSVLYPKCIPNHLAGFHYYEAKYDLAYFRKYITWTYLTKKEEKTYNSNGGTVTSNTTQYAYNNTNYQPMRVTIDDGFNSKCTSLWYPSDNKATGSNYLIQKHCLSEVVSTYTYNDVYNTNKFVGGKLSSYELRNGIPVVNECISITPSWQTYTELKVTQFDDYGNIREYKQKNGTPVTVLWSYGHQYPVMEIVGLTYSEVKNAASSAVTSLESQPVSASGNISNSVVSLHNTLKTKTAYVTGVIYDSWFNVSAVISPNGYKNYYNYDSSGRLTSIVDPLSGILKKYSYNYKNK